MKKKIPLEVLQILEPFIQKKREIFDVVEPQSSLLRFVDKDPNSDFYFHIIEFKNENELLLLIDKKPANSKTTANERHWSRAVDLESFFTKWVELLNGYESVKSIFDDPILEAFANEYYSDFEIIDEDAEIIPFSTKQILLLDEHLEYIETEIEKFQTENNKNEIQQIKKEVIELRENLTKKSKKWVVKNLSQVWGKLAKQGPKFIKEFLSEVKKEAIKQGVKLLYENGINLL